MRYAAAAALLTFTVSPVVQAFDVDVVNRSNAAIYHLYFSSPDNREWGSDQLGPGNKVVPGDTFTLTDIERGRFNVKLVGEDGSECEVDDTDFNDGKKWIITEIMLGKCPSMIISAELSVQRANDALAATADRAARDVVDQDRRRAALRKCERQSEYGLFVAEREMRDSKRMIDQGNQALNRDDEIARISGTTNLSARQMAGQLVYSGRTAINRSFSQYKSAGGSANSISEALDGPIRRDPCE